MTSRVALPGMRSPSVGFDEPFDMLGACHERVQRTLALLQRLQTHLAGHGVDDSARQAARDVLRYFDVAAPLHHQDEELHVFPALLRSGVDAVIQSVVRQLQKDHIDMAACWVQVRQPLLGLAEGMLDTFSIAELALLQHFAGMYAAHMQHENAIIYPAAQAALDGPTQQAMGREMALRRGAKA